MTSPAPNEMCSVLEAFKPALKSIDVRTVAVLPYSEESWQNLVTSIFLRDKIVDEVKAEHQKIPKIRNNQFAIFLGAFPFDYLIFDKISKGEVRFPALTFGINRIKFRKIEPFKLKVNSSDEWINGSYTWMLRAADLGSKEDREKLWSIVEKQNIVAKRFNFTSIPKLIEHYLKIKYSNGERKDIEIVIPSLARVNSVQFLDKEFEVTIQKPEKLRGLQLNLNLKRENRIVWRDTREIVGEETQFDKNTEVFKVNELLPFDLVNVELIHRDSVLTLDRTYKKVPLHKAIEPFMKTFGAICPIKDEFKTMLFEPKKYGKNPDKIFEIAISWLLSLAGFSTIYLGTDIKVPKSEYSKKTKDRKFDVIYNSSGSKVGCADIIAYEENERILLIDCDIGPFDAKKIQDLAETKKYFRETLKEFKKLPIVPVLFSPRDFRKSSLSIDVMIADQSVIKRIFEAVAQGNREKARSIL